MICLVFEMARTRGMSIGAVTVSDKVSVGAPRYTIISIDQDTGSVWVFRAIPS